VDAPVPLLCSICGLPLGDDETWQPNLEGGGAHHRCLPAPPDDTEEE
jgi:hypothetical protein